MFPNGLLIGPEFHPMFAKEQLEILNSCPHLAACDVLVQDPHLAQELKSFGCRAT